MKEEILTNLMDLRSMKQVQAANDALTDERKTLKAENDKLTDERKTLKAMVKKLSAEKASSAAQITENAAEQSNLAMKLTQFTSVLDIFQILTTLNINLLVNDDIKEESEKYVDVICTASNAANPKKKIVFELSGRWCVNIRLLDDDVHAENMTSVILSTSFVVHHGPN